MDHNKLVKLATMIEGFKLNIESMGIDENDSVLCLELERLEDLLEGFEPVGGWEQNRRERAA